MPSEVQAIALAEPPEPLPRELAALIRPELPSLYREIVAAIREAVPEYGLQMGEAYDRALRLGVRQSLNTFTDRVATPRKRAVNLAEVHRRLGRFEAQEGRSLDALQSAYRIGGRIAWRRAMTVGERNHLASHVMNAFADALFAYIDELSQLAREGYLQAEADSAERLKSLRRRLLRTLVAEPPVPRHTIEDIAAQARWQLPEEVTPAALVPAERLASLTALPDDVLADTAGAHPYLLIPGPFDDERREQLDVALGPAGVAVGLTVPLHRTADSLRWARQALDMVESGAIRAPSPVRVEDHLLTLWLLTDPALVEQMAGRQLEPLAAVTTGRRERLVETLRVWLTTRGTAGRIAEQLHVHPQTVRYRMRTLGQHFGSQLSEPDRRFALEATLRALWLRDQADLPSTGPITGRTGRAGREGREGRAGQGEPPG
ncbi:helix-turn-helix domain-containing protein [Streptomyces aculeolatus]